MNEPARRTFLSFAGAGAASAVLLACRQETSARAEPRVAQASAASSARDPADAAPTPTQQKPDDEDHENEVSATEDLMREHGVIRRVLVVYRESAVRLRSKPNGFPTDALQRAAHLMRTFAEDYHEQQLEEAHLFPAVRKAGGAAAGEIETLILQHQRGREITEYVLRVTERPIASHAAALSQVLDGFARMYEEHAAREDTIVFPAWKQALSGHELEEMGDLFEDIEHRTFGKDGFEDAVKQIAEIERAFALVPAALTAPPPPKL